MRVSAMAGSSSTIRTVGMEESRVGSFEFEV